MSFIAESQLGRRNNAELDGLLLAFNEAMARTEPFSSEWQDALLTVENFVSDRRRRASLPAPRPF